MATVKKTMKKAQSGIGMKTKIKDVPKIAKDKITDLYGKVSNRVKNATVGDAANAAAYIAAPGLKGLYDATKPRKSSEESDYLKGRQKRPSGKSYKTGGKVVKKAKSGGSFPDLNKDGKITKADILKGRGVIAKKGASVSKKCKYGCK
jgi:hypothetical protein